jgi:hypothetical protein
MIFSGLHGVISQKVELFITITVRTSAPAVYVFLHVIYVIA